LNIGVHSWCIGEEAVCLFLKPHILEQPGGILSGHLDLCGRLCSDERGCRYFSVLILKPQSIFL